MENSEWVQDKEDRVKELEVIIPSLTSGTFVGTMENYKLAVKNGQIKSGMIIAISTIE